MRRLTPIVIVAFAFALLSIAPATHAVSPRRALNSVLPDLNFTGVTLADALDFLADVSGANVHVNWPALEAVGIGRDTTINLRLRNTAMRKVLRLVLNEAAAGDALAYYVDNGVIEITTRELADADMITRLYPVDDLIMEVPDFVGPDFNLQGSQVGGGGGGQNIISSLDDQGEQVGRTRAERAQELIDMIIATIQPDIWQVNGGTAAIRFFNGSLIVTAPRSVHEALGGPVE